MVGPFALALLFGLPARGEPLRPQPLGAVFQLPSLDPDLPGVRYRLLSGRWEGKAGDAVVLTGLRRPELTVALSLSGFIELINFQRWYPVCWETWRGHVGLDSVWQIPALDERLPAGGHLIGQLGYFHESDHVTNSYAYLLAYGDLDRTDDPKDVLVEFPNGDLSSFEELRLRLAWTQPLGAGPWTLRLAVAGRAFPPSLDEYTPRRMRGAIGGELWISRRLGARRDLYLAGYLEHVAQEFDPVAAWLRPELAPEALDYRVLELGLRRVGVYGTSVEPHLLLSDSDGRGVDFVEDYGLEWGIGFRVGL